VADLGELIAASRYQNGLLPQLRLLQSVIVFIPQIISPLFSIWVCCQCRQNKLSFLLSGVQYEYMSPYCL